MHILVLGNTIELIIFADLMEKVGMTVDSRPSPKKKDLGAINADVGVVAFSSETLSAAVLDGIKRRSAAVGIFTCNVTGGSDLLSPDSGPLPEHLLQAATGLAHTTGFPDAMPTISGVPFIALSTALYAASTVLAVAQSADNSNAASGITVSRYLTAINALTTFLPAALLGGDPARIGNQHPSSSPWNTYPTQDGWVLICTSKDTQWEKLRDAIGSGAVSDPKFDSHAARIEMRIDLDALIGDWSKTLSTQTCIDTLLSAGVPAGPILSVEKVWDDPNLQKRQPSVTEQSNPTKAMSLFRKQPLDKMVRLARTRRGSTQQSADKPLAGLRVIELGQFTTAPLACRHLAHLGADVLKVESPGGEPSRHWKPIIDGVGHFFTITNTGKRFVELNLRDPDQWAQLEAEIRTADVLVENMRPDVMGKLGLGHAELAALNPDLTVCSVSGFGAFGSYPGRAAYDTIIQGMSGIMDMTRCEGMPAKLGISAADILGAQVALFAILSTLDEAGLFIDISMQDVATYAALLGLDDSHSQQAQTSALKYTRTVLEIAQSDVLKHDVLTTVQDQNGKPCLAPRLPYEVQC